MSETRNSSFANSEPDKADNDLQERLHRLRGEIATLKNQIGLLTREKQRAEAKLEELRSSRSYLLGNALIAALKSPRRLLALPKVLHDLRRRGSAPLPPRIQFPISQRSITSSASALSILDEISELCWRDEINIAPLQRQSFRTQIEDHTEDFALLESCWKGNGGEWQYAFTSPGLKHDNSKALLNGLELFKRKGLKIAFWNKEDPLHYDRFLPVAKQADVIFTTDVNCRRRYESDVPNTRVEVLPFAAQPTICNPAGRVRINQGRLCFAGSYHTSGHEERRRQLDALLPTIQQFDGVIYDRMSELGDERYSYPPQYQEFLRKSVSFYDMTRLYKSYKVFLNVNTIVDSPTMMSRRVYEILASGTPVVSAPSQAIENQFDGIVEVADNAAQANAAIERLLEDEKHYERVAHRGYREVMSKHTYAHRLEILLPAMSLPFEMKRPLVSVITCTRRPKFIPRIIENLSKQNHPRLEAILIVRGYSADEAQQLSNGLRAAGSKLERLEIVHEDSDSTLGERLNYGISLARGDFIAKMDDDDIYLPNYLSDSLIPFSFSDYALVGKKEQFVFLEDSGKMIRRFVGHRHLQTDFVSGATLVMPANIARTYPFAHKPRGSDSALIESLRAAGEKIYAADPFNFVVWRHADQKQHTWVRKDEEFLRSGSIVEANGLDLSLVDV